jgi:hypothetical protein
LVDRCWIGSGDQKNNCCHGSYRSSDQDFPGASHFFEQFLHFQKLSTAVRTIAQMVLYAIELWGCEGAIEISRHLHVRHVIAP